MNPTKFETTVPSTLEGLFHDIYSRHETMLAYEANYFPHWHIKAAHKIVFSRVRYFTKTEILNHCNEDLTAMNLFPTDRLFTEQVFQIHWAYGNIPTKTEWDGYHNDRVFCVEFRISPLIQDGNGRVALIVPHLEAYYSK
jgi:hypothetical protein